MSDYEKLGVFYLGREYDPATKTDSKAPLLYDSRDLTTHGVCVGMTGSGKTGLCLSLLEEAAIDGIPAICIDPKGDLGNLLLTFPELKPEDFQPWIDAEEAGRKGLSVEDLAKKTAETWRTGLAEWDQQPDRIARFRDAVDIAIYTPGGSAGIGLSVLKSMDAPPAEIRENAESLRERVTGNCMGLLALLKIDADPVTSREFLLLSTILENAWAAGKSLDLADLIHQIQSPPFDKVGVMSLDTVFPAQDRFQLAMKINTLVASPGFAAWRTGEPLDVKRLLHTTEGKPRLTIISIAHLSDSERMFFVTLLLNEVIGWMRAQPGTSSLRALLYMDEVFGYFPPTANPPSKTPMLTLLKQARAFGLGVVLATQNPVDLDYKGLSNCGTWWIGRLQTERDKARVLDGLEGAATAAGHGFKRSEMDKLLSGLAQRVFLMNNVHEEKPVLFRTRWALSFLRGPLSRVQISDLMKARKSGEAPAAESAKASGTAATGEKRPLLPPDIEEYFEPLRKVGSVVYSPAILGEVKVRFNNATAGVDLWETLSLVTDLKNEMPDDPWAVAETMVEEAPEREKTPDSEAGFAAMPAELAKPKTYSALATALKDHVYRNHVLKLFKYAPMKIVSKPGESEGDFRVRVAAKVAEQRDAQVDVLRAKYSGKRKTLEDKAMRAQQKLDREKAQASTKMMDAAISIGSTIFGSLMGRKKISTTTLSKAATAAKTATKVAGQKQDVAHAEESLEAIMAQITELDNQLDTEIETLKASANPQLLELETVEFSPKKTDIQVDRVALYWRC
ncbi:ATP-binding protein [bacterium]|nr:ATP-binding protein [bacterium]